MQRRSFLGLLPGGLLASARPARATVYMTGDEAKQALFPGASRFVDRSLLLTRPQMAAVAKASGVRVSFPQVIAWDACNGATKLGTLFVDKVYGKHEFITYAVGLDSRGAVNNIEIMDYRESYGDEVRLPKWRAQFAGKTAGQPLRIDRDIKNISGATLSCVHVTEGVRRVLATYATVLAQA